jgi:hypothetical protein
MAVLLFTVLILERRRRKLRDRTEMEEAVDEAAGRS